MPKERMPRPAVPRDFVVENSVRHRVRDGESWDSLAARYGVPARDIIMANFKTLVPEEVNWYLRNYVGCNKPTRDGNNWMFSSSAVPGIVQIPPVRRTGMLPPPKNSKPTAQTIAQLEAWLTSLIAGHPQATQTYTFYEEIDKYLGPWGANGYPIAYGKKYNIAFSSNSKLQADPVVKNWVWRTTIILQELLRDFIVNRYRAGNLATLTEAELRQAAFDSHPKAYTEGGLTLVAIVSPELIPTIKEIPKAEFKESSPNYQASKKQVWETIRLVAPQVIGMLFATLAGPAHTGLLSRAAQRDQRMFLNEIQMGQSLGNLRHAINDGKFDRVAWLEEMTQKLNRTEFPDQGMARYARELILTADSRKRLIANRYRKEIEIRQDLKQVYDRLDPGWASW